MKLITTSTTEQAPEQRKSVASSLLRWIHDEIIQAPEAHVRLLGDDITIAVCRNALQKSASTGEKIAASVLCSIDGARLNYLHMAAIQKTNDAEGRRAASEFSIKASKLLNLENKLIDCDIVQYLVAVENGHMLHQSKLNRVTAAKYVLELIHEMRNA